MVIHVPILSALCIQAALCRGGESQHNRALQAVDTAWRPRFIRFISGRENQLLSEINRKIEIACNERASKAQVYEAILHSHCWRLLHSSKGLKNLDPVRSRWSSLAAGVTFEEDKGFLLESSSEWGDKELVPRSLRILGAEERDDQVAIMAATNLEGYGHGFEEQLGHLEWVRIKKHLPKVPVICFGVAISYIGEGNRNPQKKRENFVHARQEFLNYLAFGGGGHGFASLAREKIKRIDSILAKL